MKNKKLLLLAGCAITAQLLVATPSFAKDDLESLINSKQTVTSNDEIKQIINDFYDKSNPSNTDPLVELINENQNKSIAANTPSPLDKLFEIRESSTNSSSNQKKIKP